MKWTPEVVTAQRRPEAMARSYMEFQHLNRIIDLVPERARAADVGAGFGRLCLVLRDRFQHVSGFEREPGLVKDARRILPDVDFQRVEALQALPAADASFDFAMTFTVLQHMDHTAAERVMSELQRIVSRTGYVLIVEDTDPGYHKVNKRNATHFTYGRSVRWYRERMEPFQVTHVSRRPNEAGFHYQGKPRPFSGHYMLFAGPEVTL